MARIGPVEKGPSRWSLVHGIPLLIVSILNDTSVFQVFRTQKFFWVANSNQVLTSMGLGVPEGGGGEGVRPHR